MSSMSASKAQQKKVRDMPCLVCGRDRHETKIDAAHVYPRRLAHCECPDGVVPLCRECHLAQEKGEIDLLPLLINGYRTELYHAAIEHDAPPLLHLEKVTGCKVAFA